MGFLFHCRRVAMWTNCLKWAVSQRGVTSWTVCWAFWRRGTPPWITCPPSVNSHLTCIASICMYRREEECWRYAALIYQNFIIPLLAHCGCLNYLPFHYLINSSFEHRNICILKMLISWISRRDGSFVFCHVTRVLMSLAGYQSKEMERNLWSHQYWQLGECCFHTQEELYQIPLSLWVPVWTGRDGPRAHLGQYGGPAGPETRVQEKPGTLSG